MATATNPLPYGGGLMSKRELFALTALQGIMSRDPRGKFDADAVVREVIEVADKLVAELGGTGGGGVKAQGGSGGGGIKAQGGSGGGGVKAQKHR
jgi:hypothetical protein